MMRCGAAAAAPGTNRLVPLDPGRIADQACLALNGGHKGTVPPFWDGKAAEKILTILKNM